MDDVETLARWIHRTFCRTRGRETLRTARVKAWGELPLTDRDDYRAVARELLTNPPAVLCVPGVVVGGTR